MQEIYDYLEDNGIKIGKDAEEGNENARNIIMYYKLHHSCTGDPGAQGFLTAAVQEYRKEKAL